MADASRDQNNIPTLLAASSSDGKTPVRVYANPTTHRLLVESTAGVSGPGTSIDEDIAVFDGTTGETIKDSGVKVSDLVPFTGAMSEVDLGSQDLFTSGNLAGGGLRASLDGGAQINFTNTANDTNYVYMSSTGLDSQVKISSDAIAGAGIVDASDLTADRTFTLPDASGTVALETAASGSFLTADAKTVTVVNGIITSIV